MKPQVKYTEGPVGKVKVVKDFLPPPDQLDQKRRKRSAALQSASRKLKK